MWMENRVNDYFSVGYFKYDSARKSIERTPPKLGFQCSTRQN